MSELTNTTNTPKPQCFAADCSKEGAFTCKRCKIARYCSTSCQQKSWAEHKKDCNGKVEAPYQFDYSYDRTLPEKKWLLSDMKDGPPQPMDPPEEYDYFLTWWNDRTVEIGGKIVVESSFFPPKMKELIRKGLSNRDLTWEYLFSDNFMSMMAYAWVPLQYLLEHMAWVVIPAQEKPRLQGVVELVVEHYWRVRGLAGQPDYDPQLAALLQKLKVTLPFSDTHCYEDALRLYTHDLSDCPNFGPQCDCFHCQARPYKEARAREAWEVLRRRVAKKGMYMMSWSAKQEYEQKSSAESAAGIDTSSKVTVLQWTHGPDEQKTVKSSFTKAELAELGKYIDTIHKQQRLPLDEELDWIMRKVSVSRDRYQQETRREAERAVATRLNTTTSTSSNTKGGTNKSGAGVRFTTTTRAPAAATTTTSTPSVATPNTTAPHTTTSTSTHHDPHTPHQSADRPPAVSGAKSGASTNTNINTTTNTTTTTASGADGVEQCASQLSSVVLEQSSGGTGTGGISGAVYTATGRPQRRAAAKVVSYSAAGPSSSEDEHHLGRDSEEEQGSATENASAGGGKKRSKRGGGRGSGSVSGSESEGWEDTSAVESSSSEGSDDASDSDSGEGEGEGSESALSDVVGSGGKKSTITSVKRGGGGKVAGVKVKKSRELGGGGNRSEWNDELDARLTEAVRLYKGEGWTRVAEHMGGGMSGKQCHGRWSQYLQPLQQGLRKGAEWTEAEQTALPELVQRYTIAPHWSEKYKVMTQERIDWMAMGKELGRVPQDCKHKWNLILQSKMKKGPFTAEEDALIRQRMAEWGDKGQGVFASLGKELGRAGKAIAQRWTNQLKRKS